MRIEQPSPPRASHPYGEAPHSTPALMPDRVEAEKTLLYGPRGEAILVQRPRALGFRPDRVKGA